MPNQKSVARNIVLSAAIAAALVRPTGSNAQEAPAGDETLDAVIVSGTRIPQQDLNTPSPVASISAESIELSGTTNLTDFLANLPALTGSSDSSQTSGSSGFIGSAGLNLLNLRNLGTARTLVLVDGRRHVGQLPETAAVDVNTIPEDLIDRIDVVTGGISAVYGADGVSGVVNFVMKKDFEGVTARFQYGVGEENKKPENWIASVTGGFNFADGRGNLSGSIEHRSEGRLKATDREQFTGANYRTLQENPDDFIPATIPGDPDIPDDPNVPDRIPFNDIRFFDSSREGGIDLDFDGVPDIRPNGAAYEIPLFITPFFSQGGSGTRRADYIGDLLARNDTTLGSAFFNFELNESAIFFAEAKYVYGEAYTASQPTFDFFLFIDEVNPLIPAAVASQIDPANAALLISRDNFDLGTRAEDITRRTLRTVGGIRGDFLADFSYEVSYVYGESKVHNVSVNNRLNDRFFAALDVVTNPANGQPTCRSNLNPADLPFQPFQDFDFSAFGPGQLSFTPGANSGCVPLNLFGEGVASQAAIDWINTDSVTTSRLTQNVATAFLNGPIPGFELPGGAIEAVIGVEWRRESSRTDTPPEDQAGLTFGNAILPTYGNFDVTEGFAEIQAPLFKDITMLDLLQLNAAVRVSNYSTTGSATTWNLGATWRPIKDIGFRAMYAESVRAPNISELFGPSSQTFEFIDDPCDIGNLNNGSSFRAANCAAILNSLGIDPTTYTDPNSASVAGLSRGNDGLSEETAESYIFGVVFRPRFAPGLTLAIDYYDIKIADAISQPTAQETVDNCVDQPSIDNVFCDSVGRDPADGGVDDFRVQPENVAQFRTRGIDLSLNYALEPGRIGMSDKIGKFNFQIVGNRLDRLTRIPTPGADQIDDRGTIYAPKRLWNVDVTWKYENLTMNYGFNYFDETTRFSNEELRGDPDFASRENIFYDPRETHDVTVAYGFTQRYRAYAGVTNLTDQKPDFSTLYPVSAIGRFYFLGFKATL